METSEAQDRLRAVQNKLSQAQSQRTRSEVERENAEASLMKVKDELKSSFSIVTSEDLKAVRSKLQADLEEAIAEAEKQLAAATE